MKTNSEVIKSLPAGTNFRLIYKAEPNRQAYFMKVDSNYLLPLQSNFAPFVQGQKIFMWYDVSLPILVDEYCILIVGGN